MNLRSLAPLGLSLAVAATCAGVGVAFAAHAAPPAPPPAAPPPPAATGNGPPTGMNLIDTSSPFDHDVHLNPAKMGGKKMGCESCHKMVNKDGTCPKQEVRFPEHDACQACHTANFYTQPLTICTNCHKANIFQKRPPLRELTRQVTPRKAEFSHRSHLDAKKGTDCTSCHSVLRGGLVIGHPSHPNCCQCHSGPGLNGKIAEPHMNKCGSCHDTAKNAGRPPSTIHDFSHKMHREDPRTHTSVACQQCHINMVQATTLRQIRIPPMPVCLQCHDGSDPNKPNPKNPAWSGTGAFNFTACLKCHLPGSIQNRPLPPGHPGAPTAPTEAGANP